MAQSKTHLGNGCGSVGRAVISNTKDPQFESSNWPFYLLPINCKILIEKMKIKAKLSGMAQFL